ncbi:DUF6468 domain-containing protein [Pacificispira spongiicola]|nr:DUF6468 domain-containing protein [Pacificispira spongiicola]
MIGTVLGIAFDIALMILLGVAIFYGIRLNRQVSAIRSGRKELEKLIADFTQATTRAESALSDLRQEVGGSLDATRKASLKAGELCDDLEFLIKRGEKVADALETGIRAGNKTTARAGVGSVEPAMDRDEPSAAAKRGGRALSAAPEDRVVAAPDKSAAKKARAKSKSELLKALQDMR